MYCPPALTNGPDSNSGTPLPIVTQTPTLGNFYMPYPTPPTPQIQPFNAANYFSNNLAIASASANTPTHNAFHYPYQYTGNIQSLFLGLEHQRQLTPMGQDTAGYSAASCGNEMENNAHSVAAGCAEFNMPEAVYTPNSTVTMELLETPIDDDNSRHPSTPAEEQEKEKRTVTTSVRPRKPRNTLNQTQQRILYKWVVEHIDHPYPSEKDKAMLSKQGNMATTGFKWWFSNHRHRNMTQVKDKNGNVTYKPNLLFHKKCMKLGVKIPWEIPEDIKANLLKKQSHLAK